MPEQQHMLSRLIESAIGWAKIRFGGVHSKLNRIEAKLAVLEEYNSAMVRRVSVNCGENGILIKSAVGYILCPPSDFQMVACLLDTGDLERGTRILVERLVRPGDTIVDVGANIGLFSLAAARKMNQQGHIYAFEPLPATADFARKNVDLNGFSSFVTVTQVAVSNKPGEAELYLGPCSGHHSLYPLTTIERENKVVVPVVTLDQTLSEIPSINLLKIDVEGAELDVLDGAANAVKRCYDIAIIVEFGASHLKRVDCSPEAWMGKFQGYGFEFFAINELTGELEKWDLDRIISVASVNLFLARPGSTVWKRLEN